MSYYDQSVRRLLLQLLHLILLQVILLIRGAKGSIRGPSGGPQGGPIRWSEARGRRADDEGQRRTADSGQTEVFTPF